jgi:hypothetical protein
VLLDGNWFLEIGKWKLGRDPRRCLAAPGIFVFGKGREELTYSTLREEHGERREEKTKSTG